MEKPEQPPQFFWMYFAWEKVQYFEAYRILTNFGLENHKASFVGNICIKILGECCNFANIASHIKTVTKLVLLTP